MSNYSNGLCQKTTFGDALNVNVSRVTFVIIITGNGKQNGFCFFIELNIYKWQKPFDFERVDNTFVNNLF